MLNAPALQSRRRLARARRFYRVWSTAFETGKQSPQNIDDRKAASLYEYFGGEAGGEYASGRRSGFEPRLGIVGCVADHYGLGCGQHKLAERHTKVRGPERFLRPSLKEKCQPAAP
jgi:hypothetical protein